MSPYQRAKAEHKADLNNFPFDLVMANHLELGIVVATQKAFCMARPVNSSADHLEFDLPWMTFENPDCWHIYLAAGSLKDIFEALPYPLPFVSYVRKNRLHFQNMKKIGEKVTKLSHDGRTTKTKSATASSTERGGGKAIGQELRKA